MDGEISWKCNLIRHCFVLYCSSCEKLQDLKKIEELDCKLKVFAGDQEILVWFYMTFASNEQFSVLTLGLSFYTSAS